MAIEVAPDKMKAIMEVLPAWIVIIFVVLAGILFLGGMCSFQEELSCASPTAVGLVKRLVTRDSPKVDFKMNYIRMISQLPNGGYLCAADADLTPALPYASFPFKYRVEPTSKAGEIYVTILN
jgi:hypothetical protein